MEIAICENDNFFAESLQDMVSQYLRAKHLEADIFVYTSGEELCRARENHDIFLMDVKLQGQNGMETVRNLRKAGKHGQVIFITAYQNYVFEAFDLDAIHYLLKPVRPQKLYAALDKAIDRSLCDSDGAILMTNGTVWTRIRLKDIICCEVFNHNIVIDTVTNQYRYCGTLDSLEEKLDTRFFRCHRSYIVNLDTVVEQTPGEATLIGGKKILVSRRRQRKFTLRLLESIRKGESL